MRKAIVTNPFKLLPAKDFMELSLLFSGILFQPFHLFFQIPIIKNYRLSVMFQASSAVITSNCSQSVLIISRQHIPGKNQG